MPGFFEAGGEVPGQLRKPRVACGRRWDPPAARDRADRARADPVSEAAQLALDADYAPGPVFAGEADDQLDELVVEEWPSR
jgi:hypothetical protein